MNRTSSGMQRVGHSGLRGADVTRNNIVVNPPRPADSGVSWWLDCDRATFRRRQKAEQERMQTSRFGQAGSLSIGGYEREGGKALPPQEPRERQPGISGAM